MANRQSNLSTLVPKVPVVHGPYACCWCEIYCLLIEYWSCLVGGCIHIAMLLRGNESVSLVVDRIECVCVCECVGGEELCVLLRSKYCILYDMYLFLLYFVPFITTPCVPFGRGTANGN